MRLTTKAQYAVAAVLDIAMNGSGKPIGLAEISKRQNISLSYLEQIFVLLRKNGLVKSFRGPGGGYCLTRLAHEVYISQVVSAVNEVVDTTRCKGNANCQQGAKCLAHAFWDELNETIYQFLDSASIADIINKKHGKKTQDIEYDESVLSPSSGLVINSIV